MARRMTLERILRDDDDASGQTIRNWVIEEDSGMLTIRPRKDLNFILIRASDAKQLADDLVMMAAQEPKPCK